jgi:hypothetical protein
MTASECRSLLAGNIFVICCISSAPSLSGYALLPVLAARLNSAIITNSCGLWYVRSFFLFAPPLLALTKIDFSTYSLLTVRFRLYHLVPSSAPTPTDAISATAPPCQWAAQSTWALHDKGFPGDPPPTQRRRSVTVVIFPPALSRRPGRGWSRQHI